MRNIYDQYEQPENRLTHALVCTLNNDRRLLQPFLRWLGMRNVPPVRQLHVVEQQMPDGAAPRGEAAASGLPDACIYTRTGWAVFLESKVQAKGAVDQLRRHLRTAARYGYHNPHLFLVAVDRPRGQLPNGARFLEWKAIYDWFVNHAPPSLWGRIFVEYMQDFEARMIPEKYEIRGTLTMFTGFHFDEDDPYTYSEAKRLLRLLCDELQCRKDLAGLGIDPRAPRRTAITGSEADWIWDMLLLKVARRAKQFTEFPHCDVTLNSGYAAAQITVPNGVKCGFRNHLRRAGPEGFAAMLGQIERNLRPVVRRSQGAVPNVYLLQRHYKSQRSIADEDALMWVDLRTLVCRRGSPIKYQPQWVNAVHDLLCNKQSNLQLGVEVAFDYDCPIVRSRRVVGLFADAWKAMWPLVDFVLDSSKP